MQQGNNKPYPPFGAILNQILVAKIIPEYGIYIFVGENAWYQAKLMNSKSTLALCLPPNTSPEAYNWVANSLSFIIYDTGESNPDLLWELAITLKKQGAKSVVLHSSFLEIIEVLN